MSFIVESKPNGTIYLYLDPTHNQVLIWPVHRGPALSNILPKLTNMCYMTINDVSVCYHSLKHDKKSYLTIFACQFRRYRLTRLPFRVATTGNMFKKKTDKICKGLSIILGIVHDILIGGYDDDDKDHKKTLRWVVQICYCENLKLYKNCFHFRGTKLSFFRKVISR